MKPIINILLAITMILCIGCTSESGDSLSGYAEWSLNVWISEMQGMQQPSTKVSYSGDYNEHTEFETGDFFGLFVVDDQETPVVKHFKVYCSGLDNSGKTVWSIFKPGCILDICLKYVWDNRLFKIETGNSKNIFPLNTVAGHCYYIDENAPKVPYSVAVDMGTSVMWSSFNLGAELDPSATIDNEATIPGTIVMWGVNRDTGSYGSQAYSTYNNNFTDGTKPKELPTGYDFSGDKVYDAASNLWGGVWRTPTAVEWKELYEKCTYAVSNNTVTFTSTVTGNQIKIKFVGYYDSQNPSQTNIGYYWSNTSSATDIIKAQSTNIRSGSKPAIHVTASRYTGLPVRPVYSIE